jgi:hypothetical protein
MTPNAFHLLLAALGMVLLTFLVGARMLYSRVQEMRGKPPASADSRHYADTDGPPGERAGRG